MLLSLHLSAQQPWTLQKCIGYALQHATEVRRQQLNEQQKHADYRVALLDFLPSVSADVSGQYSWGRNIDPETNTYNNVTTFNNYYEVYASLTLFDAGATINSFRMGTLVTGITALIIALMGLIGYTTDEMNRRSKEIAIRKVNGATARDIRHLLVGDVLKLAIPAIVVGAVIAYLVTVQWLQMFSDRITLNPLVFVVVAIAIVVIIVVMLLFAAQKTINGNPVVYLKNE